MSIQWHWRCLSAPFHSFHLVSPPTHHSLLFSINTTHNSTQQIRHRRFKKSRHNLTFSIHGDCTSCLCFPLKQMVISRIPLLMANEGLLMCVKGKTAYCLDHSACSRTITFDPTEYCFKLALLHNNYEEMLHITHTSTLLGQSIIAYLQLSWGTRLLHLKSSQFSLHLGRTSLCSR